MERPVPTQIFVVDVLTGNKLEYLKTVVEFALENPEVGNDFKAYLRSLRLE